MEEVLSDDIQQPILENTENVTLIYFDSTINARNEIEKATEEFQTVNNFVLIFMDINACIDYVKSINEEKRFLIIAANNAYKLLPTIMSLSQLDSVYIYPENREEYMRLFDEFYNIVGIYDNRVELMKSIKENIKRLNKQMEMVSFFYENQYSIRDLSEKSAAFLWYAYLTDFTT
ncbi:unnamed protein product [Rotaria sp. Silwood2]|nr:unnamed protein product [Rotaria sp. Silwood2]